MRQELWNHCKISLNHRKTRVWNRGGFFPPGCELLQEAARLDDPGAVAWKGDAELPPSQQGIKILGIAVGRREYIEHFLGRACHLSGRVPPEDPSCERSAGPTSIFDLLPQSSHSSALRDMTRRSLRALPTFCKSQWMQFQSRPGAVATNSVRLRHAAHWASWADSIKMISERHPEVSTTILRAVDEQHACPSFMGVVSSVQTLEDAGFVPPSWERLTTGAVEVPDIFDADEPNQQRKGWQATAARAVETHFREGRMPTLSNRDLSLRRSQGRRLASVPFTIFPTDRTCRFDAQLFRILLLRRLRLPLPLTRRRCVCGRRL